MIICKNCIHFEVCVNNRAGKDCFCCKYFVIKNREIPRKRFQYRCAVCNLDLAECDWGDEMWTLQDDCENNYKYCPRCGQRIDWNGDDYYDNYCKYNLASKCCYPRNKCHECPARLLDLIDFRIGGTTDEKEN